ncbi:unnamed protein product [Brassica oleracea var. botrytis]|uniref:(rape) hypothetical protein n=1 Tax=Brassica napus TaxID=3708 RepID=A0A816QG49_BRANA|nr:unnamed protein product [Brassica napus]
MQTSKESCTSYVSQCAASMNVGIGSFSDPEGMDGLAHFLVKFPEEHSFLKYVTEHDGRANAYTASLRTNYHFDVNADCFYEALDRLSQFFIKPLMSADATVREINAVDSYIIYKLFTIPFLIVQLQKHLSREDCPYHKFITGKMDTLFERPKAKGVDTRRELIKFYDEHYSANLMHLVVYGKENLDKIQGQVEEMFQEIRNTNKAIPIFPGQPCTADHLQILVKSVPIMQINMLRIFWPVTPSILHYEEAPCKYLSHLIGHEGEGSLFHALKTLGWATQLFACEVDWTTEYSFFKVRINLTDAGHEGLTRINRFQIVFSRIIRNNESPYLFILDEIAERMQEVLGFLFTYIQLLQQSGVFQWIFDELSSICETKFHYQDKIQPFSYVVDVASNMQIYPTKDWLVGSALPSKFNQDTVQKVLDELCPTNVRIFWESKKFEGQTDKVEPWYNTAYYLEKITKSTIQEWMQSVPNVKLHLPASNVFIPMNFSLIDDKDKNGLPVLLRKSLFSRLWYKPETTFSIPKAYVKIDFNCPLAVNSPDTAALTDTFVRLLMDYLNECAYNAMKAGLHYGLRLSDNGFELTLAGFNHKLRILLEIIIQKIANFEVKPDRFSVIKEKITKAYENYKFRQPDHQAKYYCSLVLQDQASPWTEAFDAVSHLEVEDLAKFVPMMLSRTFFECYIAGVGKLRKWSHILKMFFITTQPPFADRFLLPSQLTNRVVKLQDGKKYIYRQEGSNPSNENSALVHYIQVHQDEFSINIKLQLFHLIAKQATFHQLRTVEKLGYIKSLSQRNDSGVYGVQFIIQSSVKGPGHIDSRVESLLKNLESKLYEMSDEEFKSNVTALIDIKLEKHKNLNEESMFYWREIQNGTLKFNRRDAEVAALRELKKVELIGFFDEYIKVDAPKKKSLSACVYGSQHLKEMESDKVKVVTPCIEIQDIVGFKKSQPLYGSLKGWSQLKL